jgi:hypothetical protein
LTSTMTEFLVVASLASGTTSYLACDRGPN